MEVEVAILGSQSITVLMVSADVKQHQKMKNMTDKSYRRRLRCRVMSLVGVTS